jgi:hypothetical protein
MPLQICLSMQKPSKMTDIVHSSLTVYFLMFKMENIFLHNKSAKLKTSFFCQPLCNICNFLACQNYTKSVLSLENH